MRGIEEGLEDLIGRKKYSKFNLKSKKKRVYFM